MLADCLDDLRLAAAGVQLDWQVQGEVPPQPWLDAPKALHLLRVVQEALVNAVRHGGATRVLLHSQYPIETDYDRGYDKARKDAAETLWTMGDDAGTALGPNVELTGRP